MKNKIILINIISIIFIISSFYSLENIINLLQEKPLIEIKEYTYVKGVAEIDFTKSIIEGIEKAEDNAKKIILEYYGGETTLFRDIVKMYDMFENEDDYYFSSIRTKSKVIVTEWNIITNIQEIKESTIKITIIVKAKCKKVEDKEAGFNLDVKLNKRIFKNKEKMTIDCYSHKEGFIYVFVLEDNGNVSLLFPNQFNTNNYITPYKKLVLPTEKEKKSSVFYEVYLREGEKVSKEILRILILKNRLELDYIKNFQELSELISKIPFENYEYYDIGYKIIN